MSKEVQDTLPVLLEVVFPKKVTWRPMNAMQNNWYMIMATVLYSPKVAAKINPSYNNVCVQEHCKQTIFMALGDHRKKLVKTDKFYGPLLAAHCHKW